MSAERDRLDERVRAYRAETAEPNDGRATRARVLAAAEARARRGPARRPTALAFVAAAVVVLSSAGALTAILRWRACVKPPPPVAAPRAASGTHARPATTALAAQAPSIAPNRVEAPASDSPPPPADPLEEERAYGRAHRLHFGGGDPRGTLAAWNDYLARHPRGAFVPEARYNRALTLLRLGRTAQAVEALRPFAAGAYGAYRRDEAARLIETVNVP
jgi:hypothetical protein